MIPAIFLLNMITKLKWSYSTTYSNENRQFGHVLEGQILIFVCIYYNENRQGGHVLEGQIVLIFVCIYYSGGYKKRYDPVGDLYSSYKRAYKPNDPRSLFRAVYGYRK